MLKTYSQKLQDPRWQRLRLQIFERDDFTCTICGDTQTTLHVHHEKYVGEPWEAPQDTLKTVCANCHAKEHNLTEPVIERYYRPEFISGNELLDIDYKEETLHKRIPAVIQWYYKKILEYRVSDPEFFSYTKNITFTRSEYVDALIENLNHLCLKWGYVVKGDGEVFGLQSN